MYLLCTRYGARPYYNSSEDPLAEHQDTRLNSSQGTIGYVDSDATEDYWPEDMERNINVIPTMRERTKRDKPHWTIRRVIQVRPSLHLFSVRTHGLKHRKWKYTFSCRQAKCARRFSNVRDWNSHHRLHHAEVKFKCSVCSKVCLTPSSFRDHKYAHRDNLFKCLQCHCSFPFKSGVNNHKRAHLSQRLFKCFTRKCQKSYKHPQDLHRHIKHT